MRASTHIGQKGAQSLYYATVEQATRIGLPLTHFVTLNFESGQRPVAEATIAFSKLRRNHFNKWATRPRKGAGPAYEPTYAYSFENERDGTVFETVEPGEDHNVHVHWPVHIPLGRERDFEQCLWQWFEVVTGGFDSPTAVHIRDIDNEIFTRTYIIKGAQGPWAKFYGSYVSPQGLILGRRAGTSHNIGPKARRALDRAMMIDRRQRLRRRGTAEQRPSA